LRLFLYNIFNHVPELSADYKVPDITSGFYKEFPYTFFGGKGAKVGMHYDMDLSHVFLTQFEGRKRIVLFPPECSEALYKLPFSVASYVDVDNPDYERYPALKNAKGYECILNPGETLFMPSGYWHYITYLDAGFSMSQRGHNAFFKRIHGLCNIATHYVVDKGMNRIVGNSWSKWKQEVAKKRGLRSLDS